MSDMPKTQKEQKKQVAKAYGKYASGFTPKPTYFWNCTKAFFVGGILCCLAQAMNDWLMGLGALKPDAGTYVTITLVALAQLLTGIGIFDSIAKFAGAGVIVPITGFANSMVSTSIEYKKEGPVLGVGGKMFSVAGPVLACGISAATIIGLIYLFFGLKIGA